MTSSGEVGDCNQLSIPRPTAKNTKGRERQSVFRAAFGLCYLAYFRNKIFTPRWKHNYEYYIPFLQDKTRLALITHTIIFYIKSIRVLLCVVVKISLIHHYLFSAHWWDSIFFLLRETAGCINFLPDPESEEVKTNSLWRNTADAVFSVRPCALQTRCIARVALPAALVVLSWWTYSESVTLTERWVTLWCAEVGLMSDGKGRKDHIHIACTQTLTYGSAV